MGITYSYVSPDSNETLVYHFSITTAVVVCTTAYVLWFLLEVARISLPYIWGKDPIACRKLGMNGKSHLADERDGIYANSELDQTKWKVKGLFIYPVKSCKGVELEEAVTLGTGLCYDRQFAFARWTKISKVQEEMRMGWKFLTQREAPKLATIETEIWVPDPSSPQYHATHSNKQSEGLLVIKYPTAKGGKKAVRLPFSPTQEQMTKSGFRTTAMQIWKDSPNSILMASTENHNQWIEEVKDHLTVKTPLALFRVENMHSRELFRNAPTVQEIGYQPSVGFQDAYPLHIINLSSVHDVARKSSDSSHILSARNFRPNIVISGGPAYAEDSWKRIQLGEEYYYTSCRTVRCLLPNVNQDTGERHPSEPNRTLKSTRRIDQGDPNNACLGMQMVPAVPDARTIRVGDELTVLETGEHLYICQ